MASLGVTRSMFAAPLVQKPTVVKSTSGVTKLCLAETIKSHPAQRTPVPAADTLVRAERDTDRIPPYSLLDCVGGTKIQCTRATGHCDLPGFRGL